MVSGRFIAIIRGFCYKDSDAVPFIGQHVYEDVTKSQINLQTD